MTNMYVYSLATSGSFLFAGTLDGVFRSSDNGTSWSTASSGLTDSYVFSFAVAGPNIFAGTGGGVFLSTDNGSHWTAAGTGFTSNSIYSLAVNGAGLFAGTYGDGVFLSTNNGTSWNPVSSGLMNPYVYSLGVEGTHLLAGTFGWGVFRSSDNGTSWAEANSGLAAMSVMSLMTRGANLFAGTNGAGVFRSTDDGAHWTSVSSGISPPASLWVYSLAVAGSNTFAGTMGGGVFRSSDNGDHWTAVNTGITVPLIWSLFPYVNKSGGTNLLAGSFGGGVFLTSDSGSTWRPLGQGVINPPLVTAYALIDSSLFATSWGGGVFRSTDDGANWTAVNAGITNPFVNCLDVVGKNLFAGTSGGVFRSTDRGASWTAVNSGSLSSSTVYAFAVVDSSIFAGFYYGGVYVSTNLGTTWTDVSTGIAGYNVRCLFRSNANLFAGTYGDGGAWRRPLGEMLAPAAPALVSPANNSTNQSLTPTLDWSAVPGASSYRIQVGTDSTFGSSVLDSSLIVSDSVVIPGSRLQGETKYYWRAHAINAAGTGGWSPVWNFTTGPGTLVGNAPEIPEHFELFSNYPNPFNPTTTIRFALPVSSEVMLRVYDVVGREVATLAEGTREAGYHTVVWNGQSSSGAPLASGVYFFRLNANATDGGRSFNDMKKMMFLK